MALNRYFYTVEADSEEELNAAIVQAIQGGVEPDEVLHDIESQEGYTEYAPLELYEELHKEEDFEPAEEEVKSPTWLEDIEDGVSLHKCTTTGICYVGDLNEGKRYIPFGVSPDPEKEPDWVDTDIVLYSKTLRIYINVSIIFPKTPYCDVMLKSTTCLQAHKIITAHFEKRKNEH
jgi:hypothetical protein